jgi:hypothetical protein
VIETCQIIVELVGYAQLSRAKLHGIVGNATRNVGFCDKLQEGMT